MPFSTMNEAPAYVKGHLISLKNPVQRIPGQFVNKTQFYSSEKLINLIMIFVLFIQILIHGYV